MKLWLPVLSVLDLVMLWMGQGVYSARYVGTKNGSGQYGNGAPLRKQTSAHLTVIAKSNINNILRNCEGNNHKGGNKVLVRPCFNG